MEKKTETQQEQEVQHSTAKTTIHFKYGGWIKLEINANILELTTDEYWLVHALIDRARSYLRDHSATPVAQKQPSSPESDTSAEKQTDETQEILEHPALMEQIRESLEAAKRGETVSLEEAKEQLEHTD